MNGKNLKQILSTSLSLALAVSSAPIPVGAIGPVEASAPAFVAKLTPPEQFGYVASSYAPNGETRPRLIVIADLHAHLEVQRNIVEMLDFMVKKLTSGNDQLSESVAPIFVEGGWTDKLEHPLAFIHNSNLRSILAKYFMAKAEIPATQAFSERYPNGKNFTLTGVENYKEYQANRERFAKTYPMRKRLLDAIARHEAAMQDLASTVEPGAFDRLSAMRQDYLSGKISAEKYSKGLVRLAARFGVSNSAIDTLKNVSNASSSNVDMALHTAHRSIVRAISKEKPFTAHFRKSLGNEDIIRENVALVDSYLDLLKRTLSNQLTPEEVPLAYARLLEMTQVADLLLKKDGLAIDIQNALQESLAFYPLAMMRDTTLVENSLKALEKNPTQTTGILVAGGFHVGTIADYLRDHKIPYMVVHPSVTRDLSVGEQINYVKRMAREHVTVEEFRADFANGFGKKTVEASGLSAPAISNLPSEVTPVKPEEPPTGIGGFGGSAEAEDALLAAVTATHEGKPLIISKAAGIQLENGVTADAENLARIDAVRQIVNEDLGGTGFIEGTIGAAELGKGATFTRTDGNNFSPAGALAADISPVLEVALELVPETSPQKVQVVHAQVVKGDVLTRMAAAAAPSQEITDNKNAMVAGLGGRELAIVISEDSIPNLQKATAAINKLKNGETLTPEDNASIQKMQIIAEEIAHGLTGKGGTRGAEVEAATLTILFGLVAKLGFTTGGEHAVSGGLSAVQLPTSVVNGVLGALDTGISATAAAALKMADGVKAISVGDAIQKLQSSIDVKAHEDHVRQQLADALMTKMPSIGQNDFLRKEIIDQTLSNPITAAFAREPDLEKKALGIAANIKKNGEAVGPEA